MNKIICEKCGRSVDPSLVLCPFCGSVMSFDIEEDETRVWAPPSPGSRPRADVSQETRVITSIKTEQILAAKRAAPAGAGRAAPPPPPPQRQPAGRPSTPPARPPRRGGGFQVSGFALGAAFLLAVLTVILCIMGGVFDFSTGRAIFMPDIVGKTEEQALKMLDNIGVTPYVSRQYDNAAEGLVIGQDIGAGKKLTAKETVGFTVSLGPKPVEAINYVDVPPLYGMTLEEAAELLKAQGLKMVVSSEKYSKSEKGTVIGQEPLAGAQAQEGDYIRITVSLGEDIYTLSATAGKGGTIDPKGQIKVEGGSSQTYLIIPDEGYEIESVLVDDQDVGPVSEYTFEDVKEDHTIYATFAPLPEDPDERVDGDETGESEDAPAANDRIRPEAPPAYGFRSGGETVPGFSPRKESGSGN